MTAENTPKVRAFISHFPDTISFVTPKGEVFRFQDHYLETSDEAVIKEIEQVRTSKVSPLQIDDATPGKRPALAAKEDKRAPADLGEGVTITAANLLARMQATKAAEAEKSAQLEQAAAQTHQSKITGTANMSGNAVNSNTGGAAKA